MHVPSLPHLPNSLDTHYVLITVVSSNISATVPASLLGLTLYLPP